MWVFISFIVEIASFTFSSESLDCSVTALASWLDAWLTAIADTALLAPDCSLSIIALISSVLLCVLLANVLTSSATTAKPRPCSPARAASIAAFSASKLVCSAICWITSKTLPIASVSRWSKFIASEDSLISSLSACSLFKASTNEFIVPVTSSFASVADVDALFELRVISCAVANISLITVAKYSVLTRPSWTSSKLLCDDASSSRVELLITSDSALTFFTIFRIFSEKSLNDLAQAPTSSSVSIFSFLVKSPWPWAISCRAAFILSKGLNAFIIEMKHTIIVIIKITKVMTLVVTMILFNVLSKLSNFFLTALSISSI